MRVPTNKMDIHIIRCKFTQPFMSPTSNDQYISGVSNLEFEVAKYLVLVIETIYLDDWRDTKPRHYCWALMISYIGSIHAHPVFA